MAEKIQRRSSAPAPEQGAGAASAEAGASIAQTLAILHPERQIAIGDRVLEVREYGYVEGLQLQCAAKPFLDGLYQAFAQADAPPSAEQIAEIMARHILTVQWMIAQAITPAGQDDPQAFVQGVAENTRWIGSLGEDAGDVLTAMWWEVNKRFFTRRLQRRALAVSAAVRRESLLASSGSTTP